MGALYANEINPFPLAQNQRYKVVAKSLLDSRDPDIIRAQKIFGINDQQIAYRLIEFSDESKASWRVQVFENRQNPYGPSLFVPHDNENEAFQAAISGILSFGGHLITLDCQEKRRCSKNIDPNRHFLTKDGLYARAILHFFESKNYPVITLHNNHTSHHRLGGRGSIYAAIDRPYPNAYGRFVQGNPDNLIIYADNKRIGQSKIFAQYDSFFGMLGLNSIFEEIVNSAGLDGHMSTYVINNTDYEYFNVEAEHGELQEQIRYLELLLQNL